MVSVVAGLEPHSFEGVLQRRENGLRLRHYEVGIGRVCRQRPNGLRERFRLRTRYIDADEEAHS
jgi:hypothetical protein